MAEDVGSGDATDIRGGGYAECAMCGLALQKKFFKICTWGQLPLGLVSQSWKCADFHVAVREWSLSGLHAEQC